MQRSLLILVCTLVLLSNGLFAQNCPTNPTFKNTAGTFDLSVQGRSYALDDGSTQSITVQNGFSTTSNICVTNGSTLNLSFKNLTNINPGAIIYVDATSKLKFEGLSIGNFAFTINNYGIITQSTKIAFQNGTFLNNYGTYNAYDTVSFSKKTTTFNNSGIINLSGSTIFTNNTASDEFDFIFTNTADGKMIIDSSLVINGVSFDNYGSIDFNGSVTFQNDCKFTNYKYANCNKGGVIISKSSLINNGIFTAKNDVKVNTTGIMVNNCSFLCGEGFTNMNAVTNSGDLLLDVNGVNSSFSNSGTFNNTSTGFVQGSDFVNSGTVTGSGNFYFSHTTKNAGPFSGTASSNINFYDASLTGNKFFDNQNPKPDFTTKNVISPKSFSGSTPCGLAPAPSIIAQPVSVTICDNSTKTAVLSVVVSAPAYSNITYQWLKNGIAITGATSSSFTVNNLTLADTANLYSVTVTNSYGTITSKTVFVHYVILEQPTPTSLYLATGNSTSFTIKTSGATALQWQKNSSNISTAISNTYTIPVVNLTDAGNYNAIVTYSGGTCTSSISVLKTSIVLYSKATGNLTATANWGVNTDGSGSTPVNFTRDEHKFIVANRTDASTGGNLTIAGTLDIANANVTLTPGSTLTAGRIVRSTGSGAFVGSSTSNLKITGISNSLYAGSSDLYFNKNADTLKLLTIEGHAVTLNTTLNITAGSNPGWIQVNSGTFNTSDLLTLKSDANGTAIVAASSGTISGKVTVERYIPARRAWRVMCAPVTSVDAPTINAAWQEGAISSTDNPHPGYGTHITYGSIADGFDQNPQKTFSLYYYNNGKWSGIPATNKTPVTTYSTYLLFVRGNRSYNILNTTSSVAPSPTILRTTGYLNQGSQPDVLLNSTGFTGVANPYASPIDFEQVYNSASNIKHTVRVWDPSLAGTKGVGAYVTLDWDGSSYRATPPSSMTNIIQPYQGFFVQSTTNSTGKISITEAAKNIVTVTNPFGRNTARQVQDATMEVNLKVFNDDSTTVIADGVLYRFNDDLNNNIDDEDAIKLSNLYENLSIFSHNSLLTIERRQLPVANDTLQLNLTGTKTTKYQLEIVTRALDKNMFLYDNYLKTLSPISTTDTSRFTISINTADALSKAANRFSIVMQQQVVLPVSFISAKAYVKGKTVQVEWKVANEVDIQYYEVERSANGTTFTKAGQVNATGVMNYSFTDATPFNGNSYYRVKSVAKSGKPTYTNILPVTIDNNTVTSSISIYPNPLKGKSFQVQLSNKAAGDYTLSLVSNSGQQLFTKTISYNGGTVIYNVELKNVLAGGLYFIKATAADGTTDVIKALVE